MEFSFIKESALYVQDLDITERFYAHIMQLPVISKVAHAHVFFRAGNSILLCFIAEHSKKKTAIPPHFGEGNLHFALECKEGDYAAWKQLIEKNGILIEKEVVWPTQKKSFYFRDPDNHSVEIAEKGIWGD